MAIRRLLSLALLPGILCCGDPVRFPDPPRIQGRFASVVPLRAVHLIGPDETPWISYDPSRVEDTVRALTRVRALGARQVVIEAPYAFTTTPFDRAYEGVAAGNVVYGAAPTRPALDYSFCQSGAFALRPYRPPASWITRDIVVFQGTVVGDGRRATGIQPLAAHAGLTASVAGGDEAALRVTLDISGTDEQDAPLQERLDFADGQDPRAPRVGRRQFKTVTAIDHRGPGTVQVQLLAAQVDDEQAKVALRGVIQQARELGLGAILSLRVHAVPASASECQPCRRDGDCFEQDGPSATCVLAQEGAASGLCRAEPGSAAFLDPSADRSPGFGAFFAAYQRKAEELARLAADSGVALLILGGGAPYLSGGGASVFADNSSMDERRGELTRAWRQLVTAARVAALSAGPGDARPPLLLSYAAQGAFIEGGLRRQPPRPEWGMIEFWDVLDAVSIDLVLPGRPGFLSTPDTAPREVRELLRYMRSEGLGTGQVYGSLNEIGDFARRQGYTPSLRPVLLLGDRSPAMPGGAAQALSGTALPRPGTPVDFAEQARFLEARLLLAEAAVQEGQLGGLAVAAAQALVLPPQDPAQPNYTGPPSYGGQGKAMRPPTDTRAGGFDLRSDYFGILGTPAEGVLKKFWCPVLGNCLSSVR